jgi:Gas vesicle protein
VAVLGPSNTAAGAPEVVSRDTGSLADVLERVLDKGVVIAGDIQINLLDIELLTIKLRLLIASVDTARRIGINWWETDPALRGGSDEQGQRSLNQRVTEIERQLDAGGAMDDER